MMGISPNENLLTSEIESWDGFEYALREENRLLLHKMLKEFKKKDYVDWVNSKGRNSSAEALFLKLIFEHQKIINKLIRKLERK